MDLANECLKENSLKISN